MGEEQVVEEDQVVAEEEGLARRHRHQMIEKGHLAHGRMVEEGQVAAEEAEGVALGQM